ncbi:FAD-dependent oxidoreductase [Diaphorobacter caeni]|uniref:FAD-dependent oxidoreductase n=1 Tax=Diaphorobacter caeni TaxID=2784387 RepID=UPI00188FEFD9|nr:FAD-dependent oxidoreductase [Diaphorobacter caeni]MBF5004592.1 FAD-dependent oxidoreductase [Diaphorobacter caeni]
MEIAIVGAGIVGVATAYELACDGHQVTVYEQRSAAAEEASFASSGLLAPSLLIPWASPAIGMHASNLLWGRQPAFRMARGAGLGEYRWLRKWRKAGRAPSALATLQALEKLGQFSLERTLKLVELFQVDIEPSQGTLVLLRHKNDVKRTLPATEVMTEAGHALTEVDADGARLIEPGLSVDVPLTGALYASKGEAANCRLFAQVLRYAAQEHGVKFRFNAQVKGVTTQPTGLQIAGEPAPRRADAVVLCAGLASAALLRSHGVNLPMAPVYGYTISAPLREDTHAPQGTVIDPQHRITISRQGMRVRVSGGAELGYGGGEHHADTLQKLFLALSGWFPGGVQLSSSQVQILRGARPTLPDGAPVIGASGTPGIWLNAGHGASGWALACGSARALADRIAQAAPSVELDAFGVNRF